MDRELRFPYAPPAGRVSDVPSMLGRRAQADKRPFPPLLAYGMPRTGTADLPLHGGKAPKYLFDRMARLAPAIVEALVLEKGPAFVLERLSDPFWFQAFGCVLGFDWHSSGVTTTVCGALKTGLAGRETDTGIWVAGGKGAQSRRTPAELESFAYRLGLDPEPLVYSSRMAAKVDSAAVQDGHQVYHHSFFLTRTGEWAVVQQGMRAEAKSARRYHWLGTRVTDFVNEPHAAICADTTTSGILNLVAAESAGSREAITRLTREEPERVVKEVSGFRIPDSGPADQVPLFAPSDARTDAGGRIRRPETGNRNPQTLTLPKRHPVVVREDIDPKRLATILLGTYAKGAVNFEQVLGTPGLGAKSLRALALIAELLYGEKASTRDPARYSFAHGGKDGTPFPVDRKTYDESIDWLRVALTRARVGNSDRVNALKRLAESAPAR